MTEATEHGLTQVINEWNTDRAITLDAYALTHAKMTRVAQCLTAYMEEPEAVAKRTTNRVFRGAWGAHTAVLVHWLHALVRLDRHEDLEASREVVADGSQPLFDNIDAICTSGFNEKYGDAFTHHFTTLYRQWLFGETPLLNYSLLEARRRRTHGGITTGELVNGQIETCNVVYMDWLARFNELIQVLETGVTATADHSVVRAYVHFNKYRDLVVSLTIAAVNRQYTREVSQGGDQSGDDDDDDDDDENADDVDKTELSTQCGEIANYLLGFID